MRTVISLCLLGAVSADDCASFCDSQLSSAICKPVGTYCKNGHACHGMFWVSEAKTTICVQGSEGCSTAIPVLCSDAASSNARAPAADSEITTTLPPRSTRNLLRSQTEEFQFCFESYVPPKQASGCKCCKRGTKNH